MDITESSGEDAQPALAATGNPQSSEVLRAFHVNRLIQRMDESAQAAQRAGMTPEILAALLNDKSESEAIDWPESDGDREG